MLVGFRPILFSTVFKAFDLPARNYTRSLVDSRKRTSTDLSAYVISALHVMVEFHPREGYLDAPSRDRWLAQRR